MHHCALCAQCYIGVAHWSCSILHRVHNALLVVHNGGVPLCIGCGRVPLCTRSSVLYDWCTMVVHHCALGAQCHIGHAQWLYINLHHVQIAILVLHNGGAPLCTGCTMLYWWCCILVVHHCAPVAQCYIGGAQWLCTIVHRVHNATLVPQWLCTIVQLVHISTLVVHNGHAQLCTGCTMLCL